MIDLPMVAKLEAGAKVASLFLVGEVSKLSGKTGKPYLTVQLSDNSGQLEGKVWDDVDRLFGLLKPGSAIRAEVDVNSYRGALQLVVRSVEVLPWTPELKARLLAVGGGDPEALWARLLELLEGLKDRALGTFLRDFITDPALEKRFRSAPAGKLIHHAYLGGLLEHTVSMMELARLLGEHYNRLAPGLVNVDLLLGGTLLHDVGKTVEYDEEQGLDFSTEGRLLGHIAIGVSMLAAWQGPSRPAPAVMQRLMHLVLSHHGDLDKGSPVRPQTPEAMLLHLIDMLDSQMGAVTRLAKNQDANGWSDYAKNFERRFYFGQVGEAAPATAPVQAAPEASKPAEPSEPRASASGPVVGMDPVPEKPAKKPSLF